MRRFFRIFGILVLIGFGGCEEVVQVDLEESEPKLVVDAALLLDKDNPTSIQTIRLTTTSPFFNDRVDPAQGAVVLVRESSGRDYVFE